jgi:uncharacterized membrane protein
MEDDFETQEDSGRGIVIGAVILAILVAGAAWYFFFIREPATPEITNETVQEDTAALPDVAGFQPFAERLPEAEKHAEDIQKQGRVNGTAAVDVQTSAATGPADTAFALALAATGVGLFGLRRATTPVR